MIQGCTTAHSGIQKTLMFRFHQDCNILEANRVEVSHDTVFPKVNTFGVRAAQVDAVHQNPLKVIIAYFLLKR